MDINTNKNARKKSKCKFCGFIHEYIKSKCPAYGKHCAKCGILNHFAQYCNTSDNNNQRNKKCTNCGEFHSSEVNCPAIGKFCCLCGVMNHSAIVCPKNKEKEQQNQPTEAEKKSKEPKAKPLKNQRVNNSMLCTICKGKNHTTSQCTNTDKNTCLQKVDKKIFDENHEMKICNNCGSSHDSQTLCIRNKRKCDYCKGPYHVESECGIKKRDQINLKGHINALSRVKQNENVDQQTRAQLQVFNDIENDMTNKKNKGGRRQRNNKRQKDKINESDSSSSDSDNNLEMSKTERKAQKLYEVAEYYFMWQDYKKAKEYFIQAKLLSSASTAKIDEKLKELTKITMRTSI